MAGNTPATLNIDLVRGDDFSQLFQIVTCDSFTLSSAPTEIIYAPTVIDGTTFTPMNLTGFTVMSQVRKSTAITEVLAVAFTVTVTDAVHGIYRISLTNAQTSTLSMNDQVSYRYDTQVVTSDNLVTTILEGTVNITLDVTR